MPERALFLTPMFEPQVGGAAVHFGHLTEGLVKSGAIESFVLVTSHSPGVTTYERTDSGRVFRVLSSPSSIHEGFSKTKIGWNYLIATVAALLAMMFYRLSVLHTHTKPYFEPAVRVATFLGWDVIIDGQDLGAPSFSATGDVFVCISRNIEEKATGRSEKVVHIPVGIDPDSFDVDCARVDLPNEPYLLFVGDIVDRKGVPELLEAHNRISTGKELVLIGEHVQDSIELDTYENVRFLGPLQHEIALCFIEEADVVILPSKEEALGRVILEALVLGTPVICPPDVPEYRDHLPEVTLASVEVEAIQNLLTSARPNGGRKMEYPIERHYLDNVVTEYAAVYEQL